MSTIANFVLHQEQRHSGETEVLMQNAQAFGAASAGALRIIPEAMKGQLWEETFFTEAIHIERRDPTSVAASTPTFLTMGEHKAAKMDRRYELLQTLDSFRKLGEDPRRISRVFGRRLGVERSLFSLNQAVTAVNAAIPSAVATEITVAATITTPNLVQLLSLFGDHGQDIVCFVMHSKVWYDLMASQINLNQTDVSSGILRGGEPSTATLNRRVVVTDSPLLVNAGPTYNTLALTSGACTMIQSQPTDVLAEVVGGLNNLAQRIQGEYSETALIKGYSWDDAVGGLNPDAAALAAPANWTQHATDLRATAGARLITN